MRKFVASIAFAFLLSTGYTRGNSNKLEDTFTYEALNGSTSFQIDTSVTYRLFPTQNMWTFIKLNTRNGRMWQVQYDVKGDDRLETYLNIEPLVTKEKEVDGRFTLYPTQNMYTFILLDQLDGKTWQVQWSTESKNRFVIPIE